MPSRPSRLQCWPRADRKLFGARGVRYTASCFAVESEGCVSFLTQFLTACACGVSSNQLGVAEFCKGILPLVHVERLSQGVITMASDGGGP